LEGALPHNRDATAIWLVIISVRNVWMDSLRLTERRLTPAACDPRRAASRRQDPCSV